KQPVFTISIVRRKDRVLTPAMQRFNQILAAN
ncbi:malolactic fermentation system transcription activator, partial [Lacticaseibacillus paracasei subsp. paracasei Lpp14]